MPSRSRGVTYYAGSALAQRCSFERTPLHSTALPCASVIDPMLMPSSPVKQSPARTMRGRFNASKMSVFALQQQSSLLASSFSKHEAVIRPLASSFTKHEAVTQQTAKAAPCRLRRKVSFCNYDSIRTYESMAIVQNELWWTPDELEYNRSEERESLCTNVCVQEYVAAFTQAHNEVCAGKKISLGSMESLVRGLKHGYRGLEFITSSHRRCDRRRDTHDTVASVVSAYGRATRAAAGNDVARAVRTHSVSLTLRDRRWAHALGKADRNAVHYDVGH